MTGRLVAVPATGEREILQVLLGVAGASLAYRRHLEEAWPVIERLSEDYEFADALLDSLAAAEARPPYLGTPRQLELLALEIFRDLHGIQADSVTGPGAASTRG
jgi:hypothetical protein